MKKLLFLFFLALPLSGMAQMLGIGAQWSEFDRINFHATMGFPYKVNLGEKATYSLSGRIDYVSGSPTVSGLNIKPISFDVTTTEFYMIKPVTVMVGTDVGYNFNFMHGNSGIVVSPNLYIDYSVCYMKFGYDYNTFHNEGGFFVRFGFSIGQGAIKKLAALTR